MPDIYAALPGIEVKVGEISSALARMWTDKSSPEGANLPSVPDARAMQANLVLHFGFDSTPEDAVSQFRTVVRFAARHPSRVVVLCPRRNDEGGSAEIRAKVYGECFLGKSREDSRCCEFVLLSYNMAARAFLESQVSICLSTDLPLYYWAHRFSSAKRLGDYQYLLTKARRFILDTAQVDPTALHYPWPRPERLRDLAHARMLPSRQSIGQFLSRCDPPKLVEGLETVTSCYCNEHRAEGRALLRWIRERLQACGASVERVKWNETELSGGTGSCFELSFAYQDNRYFFWTADCGLGVAEFRADFGTGDTRIPSHILMLSPEQALAEAMFA